MRAAVDAGFDAPLGVGDEGGWLVALDGGDAVLEAGGEELVEVYNFSGLTEVCARGVSLRRDNSRSELSMNQCATCLR